MATSIIAKLFDAIYQAIDNSDFILAEELCSKPEVTKFILGKALLAYTYASLRKNAKAMELARTVMAAKPTDDAVMQALGCAFKTLKAEKEFCELYENAIKIKDCGESYSLELFYSYARQLDPKKMQQVAQRLYKTMPDKPTYLFWSVGCMVFQEDLPPTMLMVAQKMMHKAFYEVFPSKQPGAEELSMYLYILVKQGNNELALSSLRDLSSRPVGLVLQDGDDFERNVNMVRMHSLHLAMHKIDILVRLKRLHAVVRECKEILVSYPDQWNIHTLLIDCLMQIYVQLREGEKEDESHAQSSSPATISGYFAFPAQSFDVSGITPSDSEAGIDNPLDIVLTHQQYLRNTQSNHPKLRGPYLAELHLLIAFVQCAKRQGGDVSAVLSSFTASWLKEPSEFYSSTQNALGNTLVNMLVSYVNRFQTKHTCFTDIKTCILALRDTTSISVDDTEALKNLRNWAIGERDLLRFLLLQSVPPLEETQTHAPASVVAAEPEVVAGETSNDITFTAENLVVEADGKEAPSHQGADHEEDEDAAVDTSAAGGESAAAKKNKKKKKKKTAAAASSTSVTATEAVKKLSPEEEAAAAKKAEEANAVMLHLCSYCKLDQVVMYCSLLLSEPESPEELSHRSHLYNASKVLFEGGVDKKVEPGDELLLQNSASHRTQYRAQYSSAERGVHHESAKSVAAVSWAAGLVHGMECSPYSYGFKLDLLEPLRELCVGEAALVVFHGLGAKHIQYDTMSYLLVPSLLEAGLFLEAANHSRRIVNFHMTSKRETLENMSHSFDFANYMKGLELKQFISDCQRSTQLALAKAELPLLELTTRYPLVTEAVNYLQDLEVGSTTESQKVLTAEDFAQLKDNMDYSLLVRADTVNDQEERADAQTRRLQMLQRISVAQYASRMLFCTLLGNAQGSKENLEKTLQHVASLSALEEESLSAALSRTALSETTSSSGSTYLQWSQRIAVETSSACRFEALLWRVVESSVNFSLLCRQNNATNDSALSALKQLFDLREHLLDTTHRYIASANKDSALLSPDWLRSVSLFMRTIGCWLPLILQATLPQLTFAPWPASAAVAPTPTVVVNSTPESGAAAGAASKKKKGKKTPVTAVDGAAETAAIESGGDVVLLETAVRWSSLADCVSFINTLPYQTATSGDSLKMFAELFFDIQEQLSYALGTEYNRLNALDSKAVAKQIHKLEGRQTAAQLRPVVEQLLSSHRLSCERFREQLKIRMDILRVVLCKKN